jgi:single-strand DNA-binding protein
MFQKTIIIGRLGGDPSMRYTPAGQSVTSFSVATDRQYTKDGQTVKDTVWFKVTAWGKLAETCNNYLQKGKLVLVEGRLSEPKIWTDNEGKPRASLELTAETVKFLSAKEAQDTQEEYPF